MNEENFRWGAKIERGKIIAIDEYERGVYRYDVTSIDRPGVTAYGLPCQGGPFYIGTKVFFFVFEDGKGLILDMLV